MKTSDKLDAIILKMEEKFAGSKCDYFEPSVCKGCLDKFIWLYKEFKKV